MKKKLISAALCAVMILSLGVSAALAAGSSKTAAKPARQNGYTLFVNGDAVKLDNNSAPASIYTKNRVTMIPLRAAAEKLGWTVAWNAKERCAVLENKDSAMNIYIGSDSYVRTSRTAIGATAPMSCGAAPEIKSGRTYVAAKLFELMDCTVTVNVKSTSIIEKKDDSAQIPNPLVEYPDVQSAQKAVSFTIKTPGFLKDTKIEAINVIAGDLAQVSYAGGICWRVSGPALAGQAGTGDISGDYNVYSSVNTLTVGGQTVTVKGNGNGISLAVWSDKSNCYSASFDAPVSADTVTALVSSVG